MTPRDVCMAPLSDFWRICAGECRIVPAHAFSRLRTDVVLKTGVVVKQRPEAEPCNADQ